MAMAALFADLALARRLERAETRGNANFVEARARLFPSSGAAWIEVAGAYAMYDGAASPVTQTFGLGLFQEATSSDLDTIEAFFKERGAPVFHEISPLAHAALFPMLSQRGYRPMEFTSVMFRPLHGDIAPDSPPNPRIPVRLVEGDDWELWAQTATQGWSEYTAMAADFPDLMRVAAATAGARAFLAELDGRAIAAGVMHVHDGVALLAGASTMPDARKRGAQQALLQSRLRYGAEHGCDLAMMCAQPPGGASQRNAERHGFRIAYTRIKWQLKQDERR